MKKYCLVIDTSASSPDPGLFVFYADTIKACRNKLIDLRLKFGSGSEFVYCATIGRKELGREYTRYKDILRTDDGLFWDKVPLFKFSDIYDYNPESWRSVDSLVGIENFREAV